MSVTYMTRQQKAVLQCMESLPGDAGAVELAELLHARGQAIGLTTVYRQLEKLEQQGLVHKIVTDEGARYRFCDCRRRSEECFLIKCEQCGKVEHARCEHLGELYGHLAADHHFRINPHRTLFYGLCQDCAGEAEV